MGDWTGYRGGPRRTGALPNSRPIQDAEKSEKWTIGLVNADIIQNGIRVADERVYVARTDGLSVLDAQTGKQVWRYVDTVPERGLCVAGSRVIVAGTDGIHQLAESGAVVNTFSADVSVSLNQGGGLSALPSSEFYLFIDEEGTATNLGLTALYADSMYYSIPNISDSIEGPITADNDYIYVTVSGNSATGNELRIIDRKSNEIIEIEGQDRNRFMPPVVSGANALYIQENTDPTTTKSYPPTPLRRIDIDNERGNIQDQVIINLKMGHHPDSTPVIANGALFYTKGGGRELVKTTPEGTVDWVVELSEFEAGITGPVVVGDSIYVGVDDHLIGYDVWGNRITSRRFNSPIRALAGGDPGIYVGTKDSVFALTEITITQLYHGDEDCPACGTSLAEYNDPKYCPMCGSNISGA